MTREETVKYLYDLLKKHSVKVNEVDVIPVSSCIALVDDLIEYETDLLKEFVEWEKSKIEKVCIKLLGTGEDFDYAEAFGMECISNTLLIDLENFLEERENAQ